MPSLTPDELSASPEAHDAAILAQRSAQNKGASKGASESGDEGMSEAANPALSASDKTAMLDLVLGQLDDDQAQDVVTIDLDGKSSIADYMVIASGRSTRQVAAMAQKLAERVKKAGFGPVKLEGLPAADWVLLDAGDIVVHLFRPEVRSFYNLERMWAFGDAPPVAGAV